MKSLFIRCSEETYSLAHALAKAENRSLNKQIIHMIHSLADAKNVEVKLEEPKQEVEEVKKSFTESETTVGLSRLAEIGKQETADQ
tara:strand:+ start:706 stop:963 length:258 start_codon:yes stop_codon:yes gene_type:complete